MPGSHICGTKHQQWNNNIAQICGTLNVICEWLDRWMKGATVQRKALSEHTQEAVATWLSCWRSVNSSSREQRWNVLEVADAKDPKRKPITES